MQNYNIYNNALENVAIENVENVFTSLKNKFHTINTNFVSEIENIFYEISNYKNKYIDKNLEVDKILNELEKEKNELKKKNDELEEFKKVSFISSIHKRLEDKDRQISILQQKYNNLEKKYNILALDSNKILQTAEKNLIKSNELISDSKIDLNSPKLKVSENSDSSLELKNDIIVESIKNNKEIITNENTIKNEDIIINKQGTDEHTIKNEDIIKNKFSTNDEDTIKNEDIIDNSHLNSVNYKPDNILNDAVSNDNKLDKDHTINQDNHTSSFEDFEAQLEDGKVYLFSIDENESKFFYKKLKNGKYSKKISGKWNEDSDGELFIEEL